MREPPKKRKRARDRKWGRGAPPKRGTNEKEHHSVLLDRQFFLCTMFETIIMKRKGGREARLMGRGGEVCGCERNQPGGKQSYNGPEGAGESGSHGGDVGSYPVPFSWFFFFRRFLLVLFFFFTCVSGTCFFLFKFFFFFFLPGRRDAEELLYELGRERERGGWAWVRDGDDKELIFSGY